jgi:glucose-6-phosphate isomerase
MDGRYVSPSLQRLIDEDAVGQLRRRTGLMAELGSENGEMKLDWVEGVERLLANPDALAAVEAEARDLWQRGIRHIIWAGMGGSVMAVRVLTDLGFCDGSEEGHFAVYPLDSTDPAALNAIVRRIAEAKKRALPAEAGAVNADLLRALFGDVLMVGVTMGMTSEEPITHLAWFTDLLQQAGLRPAEHLLVMTLPGSYLDAFAHEYEVPTRPLQLDGGTGTGGRMSAPTTRVFLLPAALYLTRLTDEPGQLRDVLSRAWKEYNLDLSASQPEDSSPVRLAATLADFSVQGVVRLFLYFPGDWFRLIPWIEQLMEESLGKGGKGIVVFEGQSLAIKTPGYNPGGIVPVQITSGLGDQSPQSRLVGIAAAFLDWQLIMALYGYLNRIPFAGQPAVENYKARARVLRTQDNPLDVLRDWSAVTSSGPIMLFAPSPVETQATPARVFARTLREAVTSPEKAGRIGYLDLTINGEAAPVVRSMLEDRLHEISNGVLGVPLKLRRAPAAYHSTEQSEMDGPANLVSLRLLARRHEPSLVGSYNDTFLCAQAISTWQAMIEQGRNCFLLVFDGAFDENALPALEEFFVEVEQALREELEDRE